VREAAHGAKRRRQPHAVDGHLEDVTVRHRREEVGFLTGQPASPGRPSAGAVAHRAAQTGPRPDQFALVRVEFQRGRAAAGARIVSGVGERGPETVELVIANESSASVPDVERGHAVMSGGRGLAVGHHVAAPPEAEVLEPFRQHQQRQPCCLVRRFEQRPVACCLPAAETALVRGFRGAREKRLEWDGRRCRDRTFQKHATLDHAEPPEGPAAASTAAAGPGSLRDAHCGNTATRQTPRNAPGEVAVGFSPRSHPDNMP